MYVYINTKAPPLCITFQRVDFAKEATCWKRMLTRRVCAREYIATAHIYIRYTGIYI